MTSNCAPIHLPIHVDATCKSSSNCYDKPVYSCNNTVNPASTTETFVSIQGAFQGKCIKEVSKIPEIELAFISNVPQDVPTDNRVILNPVCLKWCDFLSLFFTANNTFYLNPTNPFNCAILFNAQTYENVTNKCIKYSLVDQVLQAWSEKFSTSANNIPSKSKLLLNKDVFKIKSLATSSSSIYLTLDQAIETLLQERVIAPGDINTEATIKFAISYKYFFAPLDVCIETIFIIVTKVPCYKNIDDCIPWCSPYSGDNNCRSCLDTDNEKSSESFIKDNNFDMNNLFFDGNSLSDDNDSLYESSKNGDDVKNGLQSTRVDPSDFSVDSSKW